jgi:hypothetical protein
MTKIDYKRELKHLYGLSTKKVTIVDIPTMNFLMIDGKGDPNTAQNYKDAIEALFTVSYTLKFMVKKDTGINYGVLPLEGLWWWEDDMTKFSENKDSWKWTSMIMQPEYVTKNLVSKACEQVKNKKGPKAIQKMRFSSFHEGLSAQIMHVGSYSDEGSTIEKLHQFIKETGYEMREKHHEIYLSDPRRSKPEKLKTIVRQPISRMT